MNPKSLNAIRLKMKTNVSSQKVCIPESACTGSKKLVIPQNNKSGNFKGIFRCRLSGIIFLLAFAGKAYSQAYDLIVTSKSDSLSCYIDSVAGNRIYFTMRYHKNWVHTYYDKNEIRYYQLNPVRKNVGSYYPGTSKRITQGSILLNQMNRNIVYGSGSYFLYNYSVTLNYERMLHINDTGRKIWSFRLGYGIIDSHGKIWMGTFNNLIGRGKNKFEMSIGATHINEPHSYGPNYNSIVVSAGYRLQSPDGKFMFRTGLGAPEGLYISAGYSF